MKRICFLCNQNKGAIFYKKKTDITGVGIIKFAFKVCNGCGLVIQDPIVPPKKMDLYYKSIVDYTNSGNKNIPSKNKIQSVIDQKKYIKNYLKNKLNILQIGSSDGYTLSQFKENNNHLTGIDPSISSCELAKRKYKLKNIICSKFENTYKNLKKYDLIILTHVLEHIYNPFSMVKKLSKHLTHRGIMLVEVPLLTNEKFLPPGYFTFEHVNYFDEYTLKSLLIKSGLLIKKSIYKDFKNDLYPIHRIIVGINNKKKKIKKYVNKYNKVKNEKILKNYELKGSKKIEQKLKKLSALLKKEKIIVWGAGIHSSLMLCNNKTLLKKIKFFIDSDKKKWNKKIFEKKILSPKNLKKKYSNEKILISTISEKQIKSYLLKKIKKENIITLYN